LYADDSKVEGGNMNFVFKVKLVLVVVTLFVSNLGLTQTVNQIQYFAGVDDVGLPGRNDNGIPNFQKTTDSIYRGGRPTDQGLQFLKKSGFKTIINLENNSQAISKEMEAAKKLGLQMYSSPMSWQTTPDDKQVNAILAALKNSQMYPIFIHCHYGRDRTGLIIGLYRVLVQKWPAKEAYSEMLKYGFNTQFKALDNYYRAKTNMR